MLQEIDWIFGQFLIEADDSALDNIGVGVILAVKKALNQFWSGKREGHEEVR
jgi:hypothetical protein